MRVAFGISSGGMAAAALILTVVPVRASESPRELH
jgi:hypothetical protein